MIAEFRRDRSFAVVFRGDYAVFIHRNYAVVAAAPHRFIINRIRGSRKSFRFVQCGKRYFAFAERYAFRHGFQIVDKRIARFAVVQRSRSHVRRRTRNFVRGVLRVNRRFFIYIRLRVHRYITLCRNFRSVICFGNFVNHHCVFGFRFVFPLLNGRDRLLFAYGEHRAEFVNVFFGRILLFERSAKSGIDRSRKPKPYGIFFTDRHTVRHRKIARDSGFCIGGVCRIYCMICNADRGYERRGKHHPCNQSVFR